jgi:hypothetical protein
MRFPQRSLADLWQRFSSRSNGRMNADACDDSPGELRNSGVNHAGPDMARARTIACAAWDSKHSGRRSFDCYAVRNRSHSLWAAVTRTLCKAPFILHSLARFCSLLLSLDFAGVAPDIKRGLYQLEHHGVRRRAPGAGSGSGTKLLDNAKLLQEFGPARPTSRRYVGPLGVEVRNVRSSAE